jgi:hypothetical protein
MSTANVARRFSGPSRHGIGISTSGSLVEFWVQRGAIDNTIVALSDDTIYVYTKCSPCSEFRQAWRALKQRVSVEEALGSALMIPYASIEKVESNLRGLTIALAWIGGRASLRKETTVECANDQSRDEILAALHRQFGESARYDLREHGRLRAARGPLVFVALEVMSLCVILILTAVQGRPKLPVIAGNWALWLAAAALNLILDLFGPDGLIWLFGALTVGGLLSLAPGFEIRRSCWCSRPLILQCRLAASSIGWDGPSTVYGVGSTRMSTGEAGDDLRSRLILY